MKDSFDKLYKILQQDRELSPWSKNRTIQERIAELNKEVAEISQALDNNDMQNLHEELGDTLWDVLSVMIIAEEKYGANTKQIIENTITKFKHRKPWIFEGKKLTEEEELEHWAFAKKQEKENKTKQNPTN